MFAIQVVWDEPEFRMVDHTVAARESWHQARYVALRKRAEWKRAILAGAKPLLTVNRGLAA